MCPGDPADGAGTGDQFEPAAGHRRNAGYTRSRRDGDARCVRAAGNHADDDQDAYGPDGSDGKGDGSQAGAEAGTRLDRHSNTDDDAARGRHRPGGGPAATAGEQFSADSRARGRPVSEAGCETCVGQTGEQ